MIDFNNEVIRFLSEKGYEFDIVEIKNSPFLGLYLQYKPIILHLVPSIYETESHFFQKISLEYQKQACLIIHLHQDIWFAKPQIVQSRLNALLGNTHRIYARQTKVIRINQAELDIFLRNNHLQGSTKAKVKLGLMFQSHLVAIASFGLPRRILRENQIYKSGELIRYASLLNHTIAGGFSKLLKYYEETYQPDDVMTYADMDWSDGRNYEKLGFKRLIVTSPKSFFVSENLERIPRSDNTTLVWNSGNIKFLKVLNKYN